MSEIDFKHIALLAQQIWQNIISDICPGGKIQGKEYRAGSVNGGKGESFGFNTTTGQWSDFSAGKDEKGGDIISLYACAMKMSQKAAALELQKKYLNQVPANFTYPTQVETAPKPTIIKPPKNATAPFIHQNNQSWNYKDAEGNIVFYVVRGWNQQIEKKFFFPYCFSSDGQWVKKHWPKPFLYNLNKIKANPDKWIVICEGEKAADAAEKILGNAYISTTWPAGVNNWKDCDMSPLIGRKVLLWPDSDDINEESGKKPGYECMSEIAAKLLLSVAELKFINTNAGGKSGGWDAADALEEKWDFKKFAEWAKPIAQVFTKNLPAVIASPAKAEVMPPEKKSPTPEERIKRLEEQAEDHFKPPANLQILYVQLGLNMTGSDDVVMNASNVAKLVAHTARGLVWRDTFYNANLTKWNVPVGQPARIWSDDDTNNLMILMQSTYQLAKIAKNHVEDGINYLACMDKRNEPQDWLNSLQWDGTERIKEFIPRAMNTKYDAYTLACSENFWISLAARVLNPGCQVDEMVVLESKEGTKKTSALIEIAGKWYGKAHKDLKNKDFEQGLVGKILVDFSELSQMKNSEIEIVKDMITTREDQYRPSYGRRTEKFPRTCILAGTTNESNYLKSMTGNRRFNPIPVGNIDIEYIRTNREQLFAEAVHAFKSGQSWWEYPADEAEEMRESRREVDAWEEVVERAINSPPLVNSNFSVADIWSQLGGTIDKLDKPTQTRIGKILRKLGWDKKKLRIGSVTAYGWYKK